MSKDNIEPAIFIADFAGKCIWNINTGQTYPYPVKPEQDGKEIPESGFRLQHQMAGLKKEYWYDCTKAAYNNTLETHRRIIAIPIEPDNIGDKNNDYPGELCGLSLEEWQLEKVVDEIKAKTTVEGIGILMRLIKK